MLEFVAMRDGWTLERLEMFALTESLGAVESLAEHLRALPTRPSRRPSASGPG